MTTTRHRVAAARANNANTRAAAAQAQAAQHATPGGAKAHWHQSTPMRAYKARPTADNTQGMAAGQGCRRHTWRDMTTITTRGHNTWRYTATATTHEHTKTPKYMNNTLATSKPAKRLFDFTHNKHHTIAYTYISRYRNIVPIFLDRNIVLIKSSLINIGR